MNNEPETAVAPASDAVGVASGEEIENKKEVTFDAPAGDNDTPKKNTSILGKILEFYFTFDFPIHILLFIGLAKAYPELGADYLEPKITAGWIATCTIFFLSGLGLKTAKLYKVIFERLYFNIYVQLFNFGVVSAVVFGISRALSASDALPQAFADGMAICGCLPMSINSVIVLTTKAGGDEAAAILHSALGNFIGIFLSPILIVLYLPGATADVHLTEVFLDLTYKVIIPLIAGQLLHIFALPVRDFYFAHKKFFKKTQEWCLVYIVYTIFCRTFLKDNGGMGFGNIAIVIAFIFLLQTSLMTLSWYIMKIFFRDEPASRVMGTYGSVSKTIALGIPLILSIFGGSEFESFYTLPILIWHPMALVVGSTLVGRMRKFISSEKIRLGLPEGSSVYFAASKSKQPKPPTTVDEKV